MTAISIVVAEVDEDPAARRRALRALAREVRSGDDVLWVGRPATDMDIPGFRLVAPGSGASRGELYGRGLEAADRPLVAFTDSLTEVGVGWRAAAVDALDAGARVVGGPVRPGAGRSLRSRAGFLVEYGPHAAPPYTNERGDVSANNLAYERSTLGAVVAAGAPVWKTVVDGELAARGITPRLVPAMEVTSLKQYRVDDILSARAHHGRLYGAQRSCGWSPLRRATAAAGCAVLPALAYARLAGRAGRDPSLRTDLVLTTPLVVVALLAWSIGEAAGYVSGTEGRHAVR